MSPRYNRPFEEIELLRLLATQVPTKWITTVQLDYFKALPRDSLFFVPALISKGEVEFKMMGKLGLLRLTKRGLMMAETLGLVRQQET